jgi:hypothetical protein
VLLYLLPGFPAVCCLCALIASLCGHALQEALRAKAFYVGDDVTETRRQVGARGCSNTRRIPSAPCAASCTLYAHRRFLDAASHRLRGR